MRRVSIAAAWIFFSTIPAAVMAVFLFGCCVLPFHRVIHRVFPACHGIVKILAHDAQPDATPAKLAGRLRDRLTLGATRCDTDIGLHLLLTVLLI
jgi:hypothetical protein